MEALSCQLESSDYQSRGFLKISWGRSRDRIKAALVDEKTLLVLTDS
jgi:hypothetical protein